METMASYILDVLKSSQSILWSWGTSSFTALDDNKGLSFTVNGFVYKGKVSVVYDRGSDTFTVIIGETEYNDVYVDELVSFIDSKVEKDCGKEEYEEKITEWFASEVFV